MIYHSMCPECRKYLRDDDWFLDNDLFDECDPLKVRCPYCLEEFMIQAFEVLQYNTCKLEDYDEELGEIT